jgi:uncharacterized protein YgbK (DUF1537 family)
LVSQTPENAGATRTLGNRQSRTGKSNMSLLLGAIADDFTGATDLASTLVKQGMRVTQVIGVPDENTQTGDSEAVIVALKSRTEAVDKAVLDSLATLGWLEAHGAQQFFFKYCSTFDSTPAGNIGPVADALMQSLECDFAFVCPAFPSNNRTVYKGHLFVSDLLLSESSMKNHPLTPMRDANLLRLMDAQSQHCSGLISLQQVRQGKNAISRAVDKLKSQGCAYGVIDAVNDDDLKTIGSAASGHKLITGGSGIALGLPANFLGQRVSTETVTSKLPSFGGRELVLAGSCSAVTRAQISTVKDLWPLRKIDVDAIAEGEDVVTALVDWAVTQNSSTPILIYASSDPDEVAQIQHRHGIDAAGAMVEKVMGELAQRLVAAGFDKLVVAGGETSGAVVSALGIGALRIGQEIDPGVPWTEALGEPRIALALKSGNFGNEDFFSKAFARLI